MKKIIFILTFIFIYISSFSQEKFRYTANKVALFKLNDITNIYELINERNTSTVISIDSGIIKVYCAECLVSSSSIKITSDSLQENNGTIIIAIKGYFLESNDKAIFILQGDKIRLLKIGVIDNKEGRMLIYSDLIKYKDELKEISLPLL